MVVIHVSSHGQQISDNNLPLEEADGYDEAIVAYGAPMKEAFYHMSRGARGYYDGRYHLRDEDFGGAIDAIRAQIGKSGHVVVTLDACHSASGTRGSAIARGTEPPYDLKGIPEPPKVQEEEVGFGISMTNNSEMGKFILISAAMAAQLNFETKDDDGNRVGSLSYCYSKALPTLPGRSTYRALFARITSEMADKAPEQTPQIEGDVDNEVFGNGYKPAARFFKAERIIDSRHLLMDAGTMANAGVGTQVIIKSNLDGTVLTKGKVIEATNFDATVELEEDLAEKKVGNLQLHISAYVVDVPKILVNLDSVKVPELKKGLLEALLQMDMAEISSGKSDLNVSIKKASQSLYLLNVNSTAYGVRLMDEPLRGSPEAVIKGCVDLIQNYAQGNTFKRLDMSDENYRVEVRIIPFKDGGRTVADTLDSRHLYKGNVLVVPEGTTIVLMAKNVGKKKAYFNVIDLQPNGKINPVFPPIDKSTGLVDSDAQPETFVLEAGESKPFKCCTMEITRPYGTEVFKVFATGKPIDLSSTINTRGAEIGTRGSPPTSLELLMGYTMKDVSTRGSKPKAVNVEEMGISSFEYVFRIAKAKP